MHSTAAPLELSFFLRIIIFFSVWIKGFWIDAGVVLSALLFGEWIMPFPLEFFFFCIDYHNISQTLQNFRKRSWKTKSEPQGIPEALGRCFREQLNFLVPVYAGYFFVNRLTYPTHVWLFSRVSDTHQTTFSHMQHVVENFFKHPMVRWHLSSHILPQQSGISLTTFSHTRHYFDDIFVHQTSVCRPFSCTRWHLLTIFLVFDARSFGDMGKVRAPEWTEKLTTRTPQTLIPRGAKASIMEPQLWQQWQETDG